MAYDDDEDSVGLLDEQDQEQKNRSLLASAGAMAPWTDTGEQEKPAQSITGPSEPPVQPRSVTEGPLDATKPATAPPLGANESSSLTPPPAPLGPAASREQQLLGQGPPQYHGIKKVADILGRVTAPGRAIEEGTGLGTLGYQANLDRSARAADLENKQAKAPLDYSYEQARTQEQQARATQEKARAEALLHPPAKPAVQPKIAFHYSTDDGKELAVYEDGTTKEFPKAQQKEVQEKYPGLTADELAMFPPPKQDQFSNPVEYQKAQAAWGKKVSDFKEAQKVREAVAGRAPLQRNMNIRTAQGNILAIPNDQLENYPGAVIMPNAPAEGMRSYDDALAADRRLEIMQHAANNPTPQNDVALIFNHIGMTMGAQKGATMTEGEIENAIRRRDLPGDLLALVEKSGITRWMERGKQGGDLPPGGFLTPDQRKDMVDLGVKNREVLWDLARRRASFFGAGGPEPKPSPNLGPAGNTPEPKTAAGGGQQGNEGDVRVNKKTGEEQKFTKGKWTQTKPPKQ